MNDARNWVAPMDQRLPPEHPDFRQVATDSWCRMARDRNAEVEVKAVHRFISDHIADVIVDGKPYLLAIVKVDHWYQVIARDDPGNGIHLVARTRSRR